MNGKLGRFGPSVKPVKICFCDYVPDKRLIYFPLLARERGERGNFKGFKIEKQHHLPGPLPHFAAERETSVDVKPAREDARPTEIATGATTPENPFSKILQSQSWPNQFGLQYFPGVP